jgi:hypothetical protein
MAADRLDLPPVRLLPEDELARAALAAPLLARAARLAHWVAPYVQVDTMGELTEPDLRRAAAELGLDGEPDGLAETAQAWGVAIDAGLVGLDIEDDPDPDDPDAPAGRAVPGEALAQLDGGQPQEILDVWLSAVETALAEAAAPDLEGLLDDLALDGEGGPDETDDADYDPEQEAEFLDGALANLYLFTALEENESGSVPLPVLAASLVVPDEMEDPTDAVLEEVTDVMMRLDEHFRLLASTGLIDYEPVDEALIEEAQESEEPEGSEVSRQGAGAPPVTAGELDPEEVSRYGLVRLTPLGLYGVRARMIEAGMSAPAAGDLADQPATVLLEALFAYPDRAARSEADQWLGNRKPADAARELLRAARGDDRDAPRRRLVAQQTLSLLGGEAEPAIREVLDDRELGGLARVWLTESGSADVPAPDQEMVFWLTVDTLAAQLDADAADDEALLEELVSDLVSRHEGFFAMAWRVDHPATADVLEAMGRLHPDRAVAKEARKAAFKARSRISGQ